MPAGKVLIPTLTLSGVDKQEALRKSGSPDLSGELLCFRALPDPLVVSDFYFKIKNQITMSGTTTRILQAVPVDPLTGCITVPVYQTATFVQEAPGVHKGYDYARTNNPTRQVLENLISELEEGAGGCAFATGLAAIDAVLKLLSSGDEIIAVDDIYGGAYRLFTHIYEKFGIKVHYVDTTDPVNILDKLNARTKLIWIESPTNPTLKISDISAIAGIAKTANALLVIDNTFASPVVQKPLKLGADIVVHSSTKYIAGHSDLVGGLVVAKSQELHEKLKFIQNASGAVPGPWDCFLTIRGAETLALRLERQSTSALEIASFLSHAPDVREVYYPGLLAHYNHAVAKKQLGDLYGGVVSFSLKDDTISAAEKFVTSTRLFHLAESLGGVKSLVCHPAQMTHASIPRERRHASGITDSLIRLSCGIEDTEDLLKDIKDVFASISKRSNHHVAI